MDARGVQAIRPSKCDLQKKTNWCKLPSYLAERCGKKQKSTTSNCLHPPGTSPFYLEGGRFFQPFGGEVENQLPPQGLEKWGGNKNFPPRGPRNGGEIPQNFSAPAAGYSKNQIFVGFCSCLF